MEKKNSKEGHITKSRNIVVFCAHNDDQVLGAGGALIKYAREGFNIHTYIFSYGEKSHPWLKKRVATATRVKEAREADKFIGGKSLIFFGLEEGRFIEQAKQRNLTEEISGIIDSLKPVKVFTHSAGDIHPDHKAVNRIIVEAYEKASFKPELYSFDVWNIFRFSSDHPMLVVDITDTFSDKKKAIQCHKSQWMAMSALVWNVYLKAFINGLKNHMRYAEVFYRIR